MLIRHLADIQHTALVRQFGNPGDVAHHRAIVIDGGKGILANLLNVGRDGHVFQAAASRECPRTYLLHLVAHSDGSQFFTITELGRVVEEEKLYLKQDLTLADIALELKTNRTYVSNYLSHVRQQTFYDYINQVRIEKVSVPLLREHPEYTLDYIAAQSGFASISTFRRAFRKLTGMTPRQSIVTATPKP